MNFNLYTLVGRFSYKNDIQHQIDAEVLLRTELKINLLWKWNDVYRRFDAEFICYAQ